MVYMDEIFGFFPPVANPPSKGPLLTLLKQGRAAGVGVVLATQNPVDLDYKGLSNIGTWWLGRLQTDRDKARVLDGLESASDSGGFDRAEVDKLLSGLTSRVFVMRNVHDDALTLFQSRWALSYLRGPLGRDEIKKLTGGAKASSAAAAAASASTSTSGGDAFNGDASGVVGGRRRAPGSSSWHPAVLLAGSRSGRVNAASSGDLRRGERAVHRCQAEDRHHDVDQTDDADRRRARARGLGARRNALSGHRKCWKPIRQTRLGSAICRQPPANRRITMRGRNSLSRRSVRRRRSNSFRVPRAERFRAPTSPNVTSVRGSRTGRARIATAIWTRSARSTRLVRLRSMRN